MDITRDSLDGLFKNYSTAFATGMQRGRVLPAELADKYVKLADIAMTVQSTTGTEAHTWIQQLPGFREWLGDRQINEVVQDALKVTNVDWEQTQRIPRNAIRDDRYGSYAPVFEAMGAEGTDDALWLDAAIAALTGVGKWVDGVDFFSTTRKYGGYAIVNKTTDALAKASFETAWGTMMSYKGHGGKALRVVPAVLLVPPTLWATAFGIVGTEYISVEGVLVPNPNYKLAVPRIHPGLTAGTWFLVAQSQTGTIKGLCRQVRTLAKALVRMDREDDPNVFMKKEYLYGTDAAGAAFLPFPHLVYGKVA